MKYGERYEKAYRDYNKPGFELSYMPAVYKRAEWGLYHTNDSGNGLFYGDPLTVMGEFQIIGTCDFTVAGCKTEKAAIAKIRAAVKAMRG